MRALCCLVLAAVFTGGTARAGGISLYEFGSPDVGLAAAGYGRVAGEYKSSNMSFFALNVSWKY